MSFFQTMLLASILIPLMGIIAFRAGECAAGRRSGIADIACQHCGSERRLVSIAMCGILAYGLLPSMFGPQEAATQPANEAVRLPSARNADTAGLGAEAARMAEYLTFVGRKDELQGTQQSQRDGLPDVETMIASLEKRLAAKPDDAEGWRTLGWSYLNTSRPSKAISAYEKSLQIAPDRADLKDALKMAIAAADSGDQLMRQPASTTSGQPIATPTITAPVFTGPAANNGTK